MIIGKIRADQEAVIELEIVGLNHSEKVEVVIDTGFTGFLMLPSDLIKRLGLQLIGNRRAILCVLLLFIPNTVVRGFACGALGFYWIFGILVCSNWADAKKEVIDFLLYHVVADSESVLPRWELYMAYCRSVVPVVEDSKTIGFCRKVVSERKFYAYVNEASNVFFPHMEIHQDSCQ